jgi:flavin-dependent dehydrogenase
LEGSRVQYDAKLVGSSTDAAGCRVKFSTSDGTTEVTAEFIIDCSGRAAHVAIANGSHRIRVDELAAAFVRCRPLDANDVDATTLVEAAPDGWWYSVRVPGNMRVVAFLTDGDILKALQLNRIESFHDRLQATAHVGEIVRRFRYQLVGNPRTAPADSGILETTYGQRWIAAGDAAASFDPLSSQGLLYALKGGRLAAEAVCAVLSGKCDALDRYDAYVKAEFEAYLLRRARVYEAEKRWLDRTFWRRRGRNAQLASGYSTMANRFPSDTGSTSRRENHLSETFRFAV